MGADPFTIVSIILAVASIGMSLLAPKPKVPKAAQDDTPPNLATRGSRLSRIFGIRRIGALVGWVGNRFTRSESSKSGGKGGGGGGSSKTTTYFEDGWHLLCIGPAERLLSIMSNGKVLWSGEVSRNATNDPVEVSLGSEGTFTIYWGSVDQDICEPLANDLGILSRWPYHCYVYWSKRRLGYQPTWPQMEYVVEVLPDTSADDGAWDALAISGETIVDDQYEGVNPAHVLWSLLNAPFPHGAGISEDLLNRQSFEDLGTLLEEEELAANILSDEDVEQTIGDILADCSVMLFERAGQLQVSSIRYKEPSQIAELDNSNFAGRTSVSSRDVGKIPRGRTVYVIKNELDYKYRDWDVKFDDDGETSQREARVAINTVTNHIIANVIANRRSQERAVVSAVQLRCLRNARYLYPGDSFTRPDIGTFRVISRKVMDDTHAVEVSAVLDNFSFPEISDNQIDTVTQQSKLSAEADDAFDFFQVPSTSPTEIVVFRHRAHRQIVGADIFVSGNGTAYSQAGLESYALGGLLTSYVPDTTGDQSGYTFEAHDFDIDQVQDLTGDTASWTNGRQWAVLTDGPSMEVCYLESITVVAESSWAASTAYTVGDHVVPSTSNGIRYKCTYAGTSGASEPSWPTTAGESVVDGGVLWEAHHFEYSVNNLRRAQEGTSVDEFFPDNRIYIVDSNDLTRLTDSVIVAGTLYVKTVPFTDSEQFDISGVTAVSRTIT